YRHSDAAERLGRDAAVSYWVGRGLRALEAAPASHRVDVERAHLLLRRSDIHLRHGRIQRAKWWVRRALALAEEAGAWDAVATGYALLDMVHIAEGRLDLATNGTKAAAIYRRTRKWDSLARIE